MIIKEVKFDSDEYRKTVALRDKVLRKPLNMEFSEAELSNEFDSYHIAALNEEDEVLACLVLKPVTGTEVKMRQVAVDESQQGKGLGKLLVGFAELFAMDNGSELMTVHAREIALDFYLKLGYEKVGEQFEEIGIPHFKVQKKLS
ncbi:GNAT family N-acetyltransferase [Limibacter armeniacum]|uniref:GNAT family N-acetyltransferase n=1 Tax=Limibacter armeniacum TaxID=466084 RepID=UPI002FE541D5